MSVRSNEGNGRSSHGQRAVAACVLVAVMAGSAAPSQAAGRDDERIAQRLLDAGQARYRAGDFQGALAKFKDALERVGSPSVILNLAECYRKLKRCDKALALYRLYQTVWKREFPRRGSPYQDDVTAHIATLSKVCQPAGCADDTECKGQRVCAEGRCRAPSGVGGLMVTSRPPGATVWLDGKKHAGTTPLTLRGLPAGAHEVALRRGDLTFRGAVGVAAGRVNTLRARLRRQLGVLEVTSTPPADLALDGAPAGTTPKVLRVALGEHLLSLSRVGYLPVRRTVRLSATSPKETVSVQLKRPTTLTVQSSPPGATVLIDGKEAGRTPITIKTSPGAHEIEVRSPGRVTHARRVTLEAAKNRHISAWLKPTPAVREKRRRDAVADRRLRDALRVHHANRRVRRSRAIWGYSALGAGAALTAAAVALYAVGASGGSGAHDAYSAWSRGTSAQTPAAEAAAVAEIEGYRADIEDARLKILAGNILAGAAISAVVFGVYQLLTRPAAAQRPRREDYRPSVGPAADGRGLTVQLRRAF